MTIGQSSELAAYALLVAAVLSGGAFALGRSMGRTYAVGELRAQAPHRLPRYRKYTQCAAITWTDVQLIANGLVTASYDGYQEVRRPRGTTLRRSCLRPGCGEAREN